MAQWVLSVAGIAILSVLADIVLPSGTSRKYIKTVIGIVVTLVIAQPVFAFVKGDGFIAEYREKKSQLAPQESYLAYVDVCKEADVDGVRSALISADFVAPLVTFSAKTQQYTVTFAETHSLEREARAQAAVLSVNSKFTAVFCWSNTE